MCGSCHTPSGDIFWCALCLADRERLESMLQAMQQQLAGKVGNAGNNAFKLRKLFKMYDKDGSGQVRAAAP